MALTILNPSTAGADFTLESWRPGGPTTTARVPDGEHVAAARTSQATMFQATIMYSLPESNGLAESAARNAGAPVAVRVLDDPFSLPGELVRPVFGDSATGRSSSRPSRAGRPAVSAVTSCLLATPASAAGDDRGDWTVQWRPVCADGSQAGEIATAETAGSPCVWARPVRVGTIHGVQVFVDPSRLEALLPDDSSRVRITVQGPAAAAAVATARHSRIGRPLASLFLNGAEAAEMAAASETATRQRKANGPLAPSPGEYRLSYPSLGADTLPLDGEIIKVDLEDVGTSVSGRESVQFSYHGTVVPVGPSIGGDEAWFYAPRTHTATDRHNSVFATPDSSEPSPVMTTAPAFATLSPEGSEVALARHRRYDANMYYERAAVLPVGRRFVFWQLRSNDPSRNTGQFALEVNDLLTTTAVHLSVTVLGLNRNPNADPDHFADFSLEGVAAPRIAWEDNTVAQTSFTLNLRVLSTNPSSSLLFRHFVPNDTPLSGGVDYQNLDVVELAWTGKPRVGAGDFCRLELPEAGDGLPRRVSVGGFTSQTRAGDIILLNVTDPVNPVWLVDPPSFPDETGGRAFEFEAPATRSVFHVQRLDAITTPTFAGVAETMPVLEDEFVLEGVVVRPPEFASAVAPLAAMRGPGVVELAPQAAYNAYNHGQESPEAIREAIAAIISAAASRAPLPWILLAGNGSVDWRNHLGDPEFLPIPPFVEENQFVYSQGVTVEMATDYPFSLLAGQDELPDALVGRIPARTVEEMAMAVDRTMAQNARLSLLRSQARAGLFVTDDVAEFLADAPSWISKWEPTGRPTVSLDLTDPAAAKAAIKECFEGPEGGAAFALYVGHGNLSRWDSNVVDIDSVPDIDTEGRWPIVASLTCLNGAYAYPKGGYCLAEAWLFAHPDRGAVANIAPTAVEDYYVARLFVRELMGLFALAPGERPDRAGEVLTLAQIVCAVKYPGYRSMVRQQHFFGDPRVDLTLDIFVPRSGIRSWWVYDQRGE